MVNALDVYLTRLYWDSIETRTPDDLCVSLASFYWYLKKAHTTDDALCISFVSFGLGSFCWGQEVVFAAASYDWKSLSAHKWIRGFASTY